ncbi:MAG: AAA family ATPase, partial [Aeoliella sp.]
MFKPSFFTDALSDNPTGLAINVEAMVVAEADGKAVVPCRYLDVQQFARLDLCQLKPESEPRPGLYRYWGGEDYDRLFTSFNQVIWQVRWNDDRLCVVHLEWDTGCGGDSRDWVVADSAKVAESFILEVERKTHAPGDAILVFSDGSWNRSYSLFAATQSASFDDLVLADDMKNTIRCDFDQFLESEERYRRLGIAWRRGALMIGPPGNGKTHCVRALVKELSVSSLYVQSLSHQYFTDQQMWQKVFDRARGLTPCVLVLEDLDTLVNDENRSFFLNQLDGFEQNHGLIVLATTNYPDRIDSAIIDRPSRFDRKYHFKLPTLDERKDYLASWQKRIVEETGWKSNEVDVVASATNSFSFAYLKELVISTVMKWMQHPSEEFSSVLMEQA